MAAPNLTPEPTNDHDKLAQSSTSPHGNSLGFTGKYKGVDVRATGMYAGAVLTAFAVAAIMLWAEPFKNPQHFVVAMLACAVGGMFMSGGISHGRIIDALDARDAFRLEMNRMAERNKELEHTILNNRLSSLVPNTSSDNKESSGNGASTSRKPTKPVPNQKTGK